MVKMGSVGRGLDSRKKGRKREKVCGYSLLLLLLRSKPATLGSDRDFRHWCDLLDLSTSPLLGEPAF